MTSVAAHHSVNGYEQRRIGMKIKGLLSLLALAVLVSACLRFTQTAFSSSRVKSIAKSRAAGTAANPFFVTTLNVNRTDDTAAASACAGGVSDCS